MYPNDYFLFFSALFTVNELGLLVAIALSGFSAEFMLNVFN